MAPWAVALVVETERFDSCRNRAVRFLSKSSGLDLEPVRSAGSGGEGDSHSQAEMGGSLAGRDGRLRLEFAWRVMKDTQLSQLTGAKEALAPGAFLAWQTYSN